MWQQMPHQESKIKKTLPSHGDASIKSCCSRRPRYSRPFRCTNLIIHLFSIFNFLKKVKLENLPSPGDVAIKAMVDGWVVMDICREQELFGDVAVLHWCCEQILVTWLFLNKLYTYSCQDRRERDGGGGAKESDLGVRHCTWHDMQQSLTSLVPLNNILTVDSVITHLCNNP